MSDHQSVDLALQGLLARRMRQRDFAVMIAAILALGAGFAAVGWMGWQAALGFSVIGAGVALARYRFSGVNALIPSRATVATQEIARQFGPSITSEDLMWIANSHPDPLIVLDPSDRILLANRASRDLVGAEAAGKLFSSVMRNPLVLEAVQQVHETGLPQSVEYSTLVPVERHFHAFVAPTAPSVEKVPIGAQIGAARRRAPVMVVMHDLTSVRRMERTRADFIANASHELKTPLASLAGFIETLRGPARDDADARERFLEIMDQQAKRMGRLISDLLSLSRIELNEHVAPSVKVDLAFVVSDVVDALGPLARDRGVALHLESEPGVYWVRGDRDDLIQVFQNLIDNALKYGDAGKRVDILIGHAGPAASFRDRVARGAIIEGRSGAGDHCFVTIRDYGEGIARDQLPRLTERFYRVSKDLSRQSGGTGLGLAIVKHIVNRHQGALVIESDRGIGSSFTVLFPAVDAEGARPTRGDPSAGRDGPRESLPLVSTR